MKLLPVILLIALATSCKNKAGRPSTESGGADSTATKDSAVVFLPIQDLIRQDITRVDSFAGGILRKAALGIKKDSAFIKPAAFHKAAAAFLLPDLEAATFQNNYTESSFFDESTNQLQFIYTPKYATSEVRNVVAYITTSPMGDQVSRLYIERDWKQGDTIMLQKLTWKTNQYFYIVTIRQLPGGTAYTQFEKLIWDPERFND